MSDGLLAQVRKGVLVVLCSDLIARLISYGLMPVYLHLMDKPQVGMFTYVYGLVLQVPAFVLLGLPVAHARLAGEFAAKGEGPILSGSILTLCMIPTCIVALATLLWPGILIPVISDPLARQAAEGLIPLGILSVAASTLFTSHLVNTKQFGMASWFAVIRAVVGNGMALAVLTAGSAYPAADRRAAAWSADILVFLAFLSPYLRRCSLLAWSRAPWRRMFSLSLPVWINGVICIPLANMDRITLESSVSHDRLAEYTVACSLAQLVAAAFSVFFTVWFPAVLADSAPELIARRTRRSLVMVVPALIGCSVGVYLLAWFLIVVDLVPRTYAPALELLPPILLAQVLLSAVHLLSIPLYAAERTWIVPAINLLPTLIFVVLCWMVIPSTGTIGAAWLQTAGAAMVVAGYAVAVARLPRTPPAT
jgi:O-antigen/teichoic acid export membrane protein